jgi:O-antigen ligase
MIIEIIFRKINIYKQFWWKTKYTGFLTFCFFLFSDYFYKSLYRIGDKPFLKAITVFLKSFTLYSTYMFYLVVLFNAYFFKVSWFNNGARGHTAFATLYSLFISMLYTWIVVLRKKWLMVASFVALFSLDKILVELNVLKFKNNNSIFRNNLQRGLLLSLLYMFDDYLYKRETRDQEEDETGSQPSVGL